MKSGGFWVLRSSNRRLRVLAQQLFDQRVVRFLEIRTKAENSAVDAGLGFAMKVRTFVEAFKDEVLSNAADHFASLFAGRIQTEVLQDDETEEGNKIPLPDASAARRSLLGEKFGAPAFSGDARAFGLDHRGGFTTEVPDHLPTDGRVRIEEPSNLRGSRCDIVSAHQSVIARSP
jgi:hypothetical protein